jgi:hypothetical protein
MVQLHMRLSILPFPPQENYPYSIDMRRFHRVPVEFPSKSNDNIGLEYPRGNVELAGREWADHSAALSISEDSRHGFSHPAQPCRKDARREQVDD